MAPTSTTSTHAPPTRPREAVTVARIAAVARGLLVAGGLESVTVREVARGLEVSAPALYKHVDGRAAIVDEVTATCLDEVTAEVVAARDAVPLEDLRGRVLAVGLALRSWARRHPAEFALLFATPATPFAKPVDGAGHQAGVRLGRALVEIGVAASLGGRLRSVPDDAVPPETAEQLRAWGAVRVPGLSAGELWTSVSAFHDLLGLVMVEAFGQVGFALTDTDAYMHQRLERLADALLRPAPAAPAPSP